MALSLLRRNKKRKEHTLEVDGRVLPVKLTENSRAKRMTLRIEAGGGGLKVTIPPHVSDTELSSFLTRNRNWVAARISRLPEKTTLCDGAIVPFRGVDHRIVHVNKPRGVVELVEIDGEPCISVPGEAANLPQKLLRFFKAQARKELDQAVMRYCGQLDVRAKLIRITDTTSRWGSCSTTRTLSFSWRIILAPPAVLIIWQPMKLPIA